MNRQAMLSRAVVTDANEDSVAQLEGQPSPHAGSVQHGGQRPAVQVEVQAIEQSGQLFRLSP